MCVEAVSIEVEVVRAVVLVGFGALICVKFQVAKTALLSDVIERAQHDENWLRKATLEDSAL